MKGKGGHVESEAAPAEEDGGNWGNAAAECKQASSRGCPMRLRIGWMDGCDVLSLSLCVCWCAQCARRRARRGERPRFSQIELDPPCALWRPELG